MLFLALRRFFLCAHYRRRVALGRLSVLLTLLTPLAFAQTPPFRPETSAAQEILRQQERERALREQQEPSPDVRLQGEAARLPAPSLLPVNETPCFPIHEIRLTGDEGAFTGSLGALNPEHDPALGKCLGSAGINLVMERLQNALIAQGYVTTRVLAGPQDLQNGVLVLTVVPGRLRTVRFSDNSDPRANAWNALSLRSGEILNLRDIEQALENFKRVPSAEADIKIVPTDVPGESDLLVTWKQAFPFRFTVGANDGGSRSTGKYLGSATVSADHFLALNDLFYLSANQDMGGGDPGNRGTLGYTAHYSLPYGHWLLSATASRNGYHQNVAGMFQNYEYSGTSENTELKLSRLLFRNNAHKTTASVRAYLTTSNNFIDDTEVEVQRRRMAGWEATLAHKAFLGTATLDVSLSYRHGTGAFHALSAPEELFDEGTARPIIISTDNSFSLPIPLGSTGTTLRYSGVLRAQWNRTPLITQDRFSLGGRYTVRGFDGESVLMAERGWLIRNDLGVVINALNSELYVGLDHGELAGPSTEYLLGRRLTGAVLGVRGAYKNVSYDLFAGGPLRHPDRFRNRHLAAGFNVSIAF